MVRCATQNGEQNKLGKRHTTDPAELGPPGRAWRAHKQKNEDKQNMFTTTTATMHMHMRLLFPKFPIPSGLSSALFLATARVPRPNYMLSVWFTVCVKHSKIVPSRDLKLVVA